MGRYVTERKYPGSTILIARHGRIVHAASTGARDVEVGLPFQRDTLVRLFSMTKPVVSVALMMLAERGLFHLDAPVSAFLPEFGDMQALVPGATAIDQTEAAPSPTLHQLLTHTSGLSYGFNPGLVPEAMEASGIQFSPDKGVLADMVTRVAALPLAFRPGASWEYSIGIDIIGRVIEVVSGQTLDRFLADEVFAPLGMDDTGFTVYPGDIDRFAALYTPLEGDAMALNARASGTETLRRIDGGAASPWTRSTLFSGGGGLTGTIDDYMRFADMLRLGGTVSGKPAGRRLLSPNTMRFMMQNHLPGDIASMGPSSFAEQPMEGIGFGLGGAVLLNPGRARTPGHAGDFSWGGMASTFFWVDPEADMSVVFLTQLAPSSAYPSRAELKALVMAALIG
ncbi:MAG: beta-lactamase family protein [Rhodobacteraceae bacterium]|nr:beta-lactamase family protein [Paracoccaceae bacterium]